MSKSIEALNRIETIAPFNRENKPNYYSQFMQSETPFYEDFDLVKKDLEVLEILKKHYNKDSLIKSLNSFISFHIYKDDKDFNKIKEWLESE